MHQLPPSVEALSLIAGVLLLVAVLSSRLSARTGVPSLVLFLLVGMAAGSDGLGGIWFDNAHLAQDIGIVCLVAILFSGGLSTPASVVRLGWQPALSLATIGVILTAASAGAFAAWFLGRPWSDGLLLGAIVSSTDAAAVFAVLRGQGIRLPSRVQATLELESGFNDPMAVFLTLTLTAFVAGGAADPSAWAWVFVKQMGLGALGGLAVGRLARETINRLSLPLEDLYSALTVAAMLLSFGLAGVLGGSGFLAVYLTGLSLGAGSLLHKKSLIGFHQALAGLMEIVLFLALGLLVFPGQLGEVALAGLLLAAFLVFVARPLAVFLSLPFSGFSWREKILLSWVGLRGAVPIVLATIPWVEGISGAQRNFHLVFFVVLGSVLVQGSGIGWITRILRLRQDEAGAGKMLELQLRVAPSSALAGKRIFEMNLPPSAFVVMLSREGIFLTPRGQTAFAPGDEVQVLVAPAEKESVERLFV